MSDNSSAGFPGFHSHSYDRDYARPLFRVASFSDSGDEQQERHASSPRGRSSYSLSRTPSNKTAAALSRLSSPSVSSKLSMKKLQQAVDAEKSMEDEGN